MRTEDDRWLDHLEYSCIEADLLSLQVDAVARVICTLLQQFNQLKKSGSFSVNELVFADLVREPLDSIESELDQKLYGP